MEILLASPYSLYAPYSLYWHSILRLEAFFVFSCDKGCCYICICLIYFTSKHSRCTRAVEGNQDICM
uniref:Uncharacterized protein n=1 Tax=Salix viminalis TaxID=40686 RepID=A0A6N2KQK4_SALVM